MLSKESTLIKEENVSQWQISRINLNHYWIFECGSHFLDVDPFDDELSWDYGSKLSWSFEGILPQVGSLYQVLEDLSMNNKMIGGQLWINDLQSHEFESVALSYKTFLCP